MTKYERAYRAYMSIETAEDLKKNKLTLLDYRVICETLKDLYDTGESATFIENVAKWFKNQGLIVTKSTDGIGWTIERDE